MEEFSRMIVQEVLTAWVMLIFWLMFFAVSVYCAFRTGMWHMYVIAAGCLGLIVFYIYRIANVWGPWEHALYLRLATLSFGFSILLVYKQLYSQFKEVFPERMRKLSWKEGYGDNDK